MGTNEDAKALVQWGMKYPILALGVALSLIGIGCTAMSWQARIEMIQKTVDSHDQAIKSIQNSLIGLSSDANMTRLQLSQINQQITRQSVQLDALVIEWRKPSKP